MNKKILALLMAILMVVMSSVAMAEGYTAGGDTLNITKKYVLVGENGQSPAETFDFSIDTPEGYPEVKVTTDPAFVEGAATTDGATANIVLTIPAATEYKVPGEYVYTITEKASDNQGVATITDKMTLKVTILTEANGTLVRVYSFKQGTNKVTDVTNTYSAGDLTIDKTVEGLMADRTEEFDVTVVLTAAKNIYKDLITVPAGATATQTDDNTVTITGVKVSHNGTDPVIAGIPYGTTYTVTENMTADQLKVYDATKSTTTGTGTVAATQTVALKNVAADTTIDTGVNTDNMPYFMLMAFVMIIAAAVVLKKRTVNE